MANLLKTKLQLLEGILLFNWIFKKCMYTFCHEAPKKYEQQKRIKNKKVHLHNICTKYTKNISLTYWEA